MVGGGPSGLCAALFLARSMRTVVVVDAGRPRNYAAPGVHGFLGHHGIAPAELRRLGREEARAHGAQFLDGVVVAAERQSDGLFLAVVQAGEGGRSLRCRRILFATGVVDNLPEWEAFDRYYGRTVFHCPDCDAWEVRGRRIVVAGREKAAGSAIALRTWSEDVTLVVEEAPDDELAAKLDAARVPRVRGRIEALEGDEEVGRVAAVRLADGSRIACEAVFFHYGTRLSPGPHGALGCRVDDETGLLDVDSKGRTCVDGVFAAGDLTGMSQLAIVAAAEGAISALAIHKSLLAEELRD